jgi:hypothetical protein
VLAVVTRLYEDFNPTEVKLLRALYLWRDVFG